MKKKSVYVILLVLYTLGISCKENSSTEKKSVLLSITTNLDTPSSKAGAVLKNSFVAGDSMGVFLFEENDPYLPYLENGLNMNIKSTYLNGSWNFEKDVPLLEKKARAGAIYPYMEEVLDYSNIPIMLYKQQDIMIHDPEAVCMVSRQAATCSLKFKHVLACITLLVRTEIPDKQLTSISLSDYDRTKNHLIYSTGYLNGYTGEFHSLSGNGVTLNTGETFTHEFPSLDDARAINFYVFPTDRAYGINSRLNLNLHFYLNSHPLWIEDAFWEAGKRYVYYISATSDGSVKMQRALDI